MSTREVHVCKRTYQRQGLLVCCHRKTVPPLRIALTTPLVSLYPEAKKESRSVKTLVVKGDGIVMWKTSEGQERQHRGNK